MRELLFRFWNDDSGAVVSVEILLIICILIFGLIPGLVALRNSMNATLTTVGNLLITLIPSFTFSGFAIIGTDGMGNTITVVQVNGFQFDPNVSYLTADQTDPILIPSTVVIPPAP